MLRAIARTTLNILVCLSLILVPNLAVQIYAQSIDGSDQGGQFTDSLHLPVINSGSSSGAQAGPGLHLSVDPQQQDVQLDSSLPTDRERNIMQAAAVASDEPRQLIENVEIALASMTYQFLAGNKLRIQATFTNLTSQSYFHQPFFFTVNPKTKNIVSSTEPTVTDADLGGDGILAPNETTAMLIFEVIHKNKPFQYFVDANAVVQVPTPLSLSIEAGSDSITIPQGDSQNIVSLINLTKTDGETVNITNVATVTPDDAGLTITSDYPSSGYFASSSTAFVLNQSFAANQPGTYLVTNVATVQGTTTTATDTINITVEPPGGSPVIGLVNAYPSGIQRDVPTDITFTAIIANFNVAPEFLSLRRLDGVTDPLVGELRDNGTNGDLQAGDGVYSGSFFIHETIEGTIRYQASGDFPGAGEQTSGEGTLVVTNFPTQFAPSDETKIVIDPQTNLSFYSNEVIAEFAGGTSSARRGEIAAAIGGTIVGTFPGLGSHQILLSTSTLAGVNDAVTTLLTFPEVAAARPHNVGVQPGAVTPNDPEFGNQYAPQKIRADEAWIVSRVGPVIAIVDTGVDYNHEDLAGKVIKGPDTISGDDDPMDEASDSHGTHVAGIAAAEPNNGKGIAGVAWYSKILAIRAIGTSGSWEAFAAGIEAAANQGAKIINISGGGAFDHEKVRQAVDHAVATGCLVISIPLNLSQVSAGTLVYPGAYDNVFAVGGTNETDGIYSLSNPASYVDIAAPGNNILSTIRSANYGNLSGTSMAAPHVAGAAAVVWGRFPSWTAAQVRQRLEQTAVKLSIAGLGAGRIDLFEAVFNGSFEDGLKSWDATGTADSIASLGPIQPTHPANPPQRMGVASSGPDDAQVQTVLEQSFIVQPDVTSIPIKLDYNFVSEEWTEWIGLGYNDNMRILLINSTGEEVQLAYEDIDHSAFTMFTGVDFPGGDSTIGQTGWKKVDVVVPVTAGTTYRLRIIVRDEGDGIYDSNVLIDNIRFK